MYLLSGSNHILFALEVTSESNFLNINYLLNLSKSLLKLLLGIEGLWA